MVPGTEDLSGLSAWSATTPSPPKGGTAAPREGTGQQEGCKGDLAGRAEQVSEHAAAGVLPAGEQHSSSCQLLPQLSQPRSSQSTRREQVLGASTSSQAEGRKEEKWKADCPSRLPLPKHISPSPCRRTPGAGSDGSQRRTGQKIHLPASLARDERSRDPLLAMAAQGHTKQVPLAGAADFARRSSDASPTLQLKCQTSDLLHSRVFSLFSSPSLCQHGRAVEIQPPFSGE